MTDKDGWSAEVTAYIEDGTRENRVAEEIRKAFTVQVDGKRLRAERDDGEDVLLKRRFGTPRFSLQVLRNTVRGVDLELERE